MPRLSESYLEELGLAGGVSYDDLKGEIPGFGIPSREEWGPLFANLPVADGRFQAKILLSNGILQAKTMQSTLGQMAKNVGVPFLEAFDALAKAVGVDIVGLLSDALQQIAQAAIDAALDLAESALGVAMKGLDVAIDLVGAIPLYGYVLEMILGLVKGVVGIVNIIKQQKQADKLSKIKEYPFPAYDPEFDLDIFNAGLNLVSKSLDWTWIWTPPSLGEDPLTGERFGVVDITGDAITIRGLVPTDSPGCTPGIALAHQGAFLYSNPFSTQILDTGDISLPSIRQQHLYLWKSLSQNNMQPAIYCVDAEKIESQWTQYVHDFWLFLYEGTKQAAMPGGFTESQRAQLQLFYAGTASQPGPFYGMNLYSGHPPTTAEVENVLAVKEAKTLRKRQDALLDTVLIAYLNPDMVALKPGSSLRTKWNQRKVELLQHPARCAILLDDVVDAVYLQYLIESGVGTPKCMTIDKIAVPGFSDTHVPKGTTAVGDVLGVPTPPTTTEQLSWLRRYGPWIAGGSAAAILAYWAYRSYRSATRVPNPHILEPSVDERSGFFHVRF